MENNDINAIIVTSNLLTDALLIKENYGANMFQVSKLMNNCLNDIILVEEHFNAISEAFQLTYLFMRPVQL
jgi:hypothetical protein